MLKCLRDGTVGCIIFASTCRSGSVFIELIEHSKGGHHEFFGCRTRDEAYSHAPVESEWGDDGLDGVSCLTEVRLFLLFVGGEIRTTAREIAQHPSDN